MSGIQVPGLSAILLLFPITRQLPSAQPLSGNHGAWEGGPNLLGDLQVLRTSKTIAFNMCPGKNDANANNVEMSSKQIFSSLVLPRSPSLVSITKQNVPKGMKYRSSELRGKLTECRSPVEGRYDWPLLGFPGYHREPRPLLSSSSGRWLCHS